MLMNRKFNKKYFFLLSYAYFEYSRSDPARYRVSIGLHNRLKPDSWTLTRQKIAKVVKHSQYSSKTLYNDIALIKLNVKIKLIILFNVIIRNFNL